MSENEPELTILPNHELVNGVESSNEELMQSGEELPEEENYLSAEFQYYFHLFGEYLLTPSAFTTALTALGRIESQTGHMPAGMDELKSEVTSFELAMIRLGFTLDIVSVYAAVSSAFTAIFNELVGIADGNVFAVIALISLVARYSVNPASLYFLTVLDNVTKVGPNSEISYGTDLYPMDLSAFSTTFSRGEK